MSVRSSKLTLRRYVPVLALAPMAVLALCAAIAAPPKSATKFVPTKKAASKTAAVNFQRDILPLTNKYCVPCHNAKAASGGVAMDNVKTEAQMLKAKEVWERVASNIGAGTMPPDNMPKPTIGEKELVSHYIEGTITKAECALNDPGRVTMRRLNRAEYNNTVRDLLGVDLHLADEFPSDDVGYGFDNIGDVLSLSPLLMEKYLRAAEKLSAAAIRTPEDANRPTVLKGNKLEGGGDDAPNGGKSLMSAGTVTTAYEFPAPGDYEVVVRAWAQQAGPEPARMAFRLDDRDIIPTLDVPARRPQNYTMPILKIKFTGKQRLSVSFLNDYYNTDSPDKKLRGDRNFFLESISVRGPIGAKGLVGKMPETYTRVITCKPGAGDPTKDVCTQSIARNFARRAYRRPVTSDEVSRLTRYVGLAKEAGYSFEKGVQLMIQATLCSPNFLFRIEPEPAASVGGGRRALNDFEIASRLSYFLWSSMPDDTLLSLAEKKQLHKGDVLAAQAKRMLADPRAKALTDNFAAQWLQLRSINIVTPDRAKFPAWTDALRQDMRTETEMYFNNVVQNDRPITEFLDSKYTFLNERLAKHYGNTQVTGDTFRKVVLQGNQRGGLVTQASILTVTSNPTRTSPVKRGRWVLDNILGTPVPPAPPNVPQLADDQEEKKNKLTGTLRQRLEEHRKNPACASCHKRMDPIGFGLENYNAIGQWRMRDGDKETDPLIDAKGTLVDGRSFEGSAQLKKLLLQSKGQFAKAFTERMLTYALGRGIVSRDKCNVEAMAERVAAKNFRFSSVIAEIVTSQPFREKRADGQFGKVAKN